MAKFRKKPVIVDAMQFNGYFGGFTSVTSWAKEFGKEAVDWKFNVVSGILYVPTLEGTMEASPGDWIIRGVNGEFYPCKPDIFMKTYEPAEE